MGIFNKDGTTQGQSTKSKVTQGGGQGIFPGTKGGVERSSDAAITVIAGDVTNPTTRVLRLEAGQGAEITASENARETTVTFGAQRGEMGYQGDYLVRLYIGNDTDTAPQSPTDVRWIPDTDGAGLGSLTGTNEAGWTLTPHSIPDTEDIYVVQALYSPAIDTDSPKQGVTVWDTPFLLTREGPEIDLDTDVVYNTIPADSDGSAHFNRDPEGEYQLTLNIPRGAGQVDWVNNRDDSEYMSSVFELDASTGLEFVADGNNVLLRRYTAPTSFAIALSGTQGNRSWFNSTSTNTVSVSASHGALTTINTATITGGTATIDNDNNTVSHPVSATPGTYELTVNATGNNSDGSITGQTDSASSSYTVYRDYWFATNQASSTAPFNASVGRQGHNFSDQSFTARGHTFLTVPASVNTLTFHTNLGTLSTTSSTTSVVLNGVTESYTRYYLGQFDSNTTVTTEGG